MKILRGLSPCRSAGAALAVLLSGCQVVREAHEAQDEVRTRGSGIHTNVSAQVNLVGCSLRELVDFAMTNRPTIVSARLAVEDARLAVKAVDAEAPLVSRTPWTAPKLSVGGDYGAVSEASSSRLGWNTEGTASAALSLDLLVWDFGRNDAQRTAAVENVLGAEQELVHQGYLVFNDVVTAYFATLEADSLLLVAQTNVNVYADHLKQAEVMLEAGEAQPLDVTRARLDLSQAREREVAASNLVVTSGAELLRALGIEYGRGTRETVLGHLENPLFQVRRAFEESDWTVEDAFALARTNAPAMAVARAKLRAASAQVDAAVRDLLPKVSMSASLNWTDPLWLWRWGASVSQTLFTGFRKTTALRRAVVAMKSAAADVDEVEQELSLTIGLDVAERDNAREALKTALDSIVSARENYATVRAQYDEGEASRIDFTDAVNSYAAAAGSAITAYYNGQLAEARLMVLLGQWPVFNEKVEVTK